MHIDGLIDKFNLNSRDWETGIEMNLL